MSIIIVLGGPLEGDKPGIWLKSRLDKLISIYNDIKPSYVILSGGNVHGYIEADIMYDYIRNNSYINMSTILKESSSCNTYENAYYTNEMIINKDMYKIYVLTSDFHSNRSLYIFNQIFNTEIYMIKANTPINNIEMNILKQKEKISLQYIKDYFNS